MSRPAFERDLPAWMYDSLAARVFEAQAQLRAGVLRATPALTGAVREVAEALCADDWPLASQLAECKRYIGNRLDLPEADYPFAEDGDHNDACGLHLYALLDGVFFAGPAIYGRVVDPDGPSRTLQAILHERARYTTKEVLALV